MDKQKQIEKMAKASGGCDYPHRPCEKCWCKEKDECSAYAYANSFYEKGYRKIPENAVVLTKEEYETICFNFDESERQGRKINDMYGQCLMAYTLVKDENEKLKTKLKQARKETAEKFAEMVFNLFAYDKQFTMISRVTINEICKEITEGK